MAGQIPQMFLGGFVEVHFEKKLTGRKSILVVEDDRGIREALKVFLELEGYSVFSAENGKVALEILSKISDVGVIILDLMMPIMNGWQFIEKMKERKDTGSYYIIVVTAYADQAHSLQNMDILNKPVNLEELLTLVNRYCDE